MSTTSDVKTCEIFVPPIKLQRTFGKTVEKVRELFWRMEDAAAETTALSESLTARPLA